MKIKSLGETIRSNEWYKLDRQLIQYHITTVVHKHRHELDWPVERIIWDNIHIMIWFNMDETLYEN